MGLYLCVFQDDDELDGVDVGSYGDFNRFRSIVQEHEHCLPGSSCPALLHQHDSDGEWTTDQCAKLEKELQAIAQAFRASPPIEFESDWQREVARQLRLQPQDLYESFIDVDGEPLIERLLVLCRLAHERGLSILFQ